MPIKLTQRSVSSLKAKSVRYEVCDSELAGFRVRVAPDGEKTFAVLYRAGSGREAQRRRLTIGRYGTLTVDQARISARRILGQVAQGEDPASERTKSRKSLTLAALGASYLVEVRNRRKQTTAVEYSRMWQKHVIPALGAKKVSEIATGDVRRLHRSMSGTPYLANRVVAMLGGFFSFAAQEEAREAHDNPAHGIEFYPERARERFLSAAEFRRLGEALSKAESEGIPPAPSDRRTPQGKHTLKHRPRNWDAPRPADPFAIAAVRLLALTGCRESEILSLRWDAVDLETGYLRFADTKTGPSNRPIGDSAAEILRNLPRIAGNPYVLPGSQSGQHLKEIKRLWHAVRHAAKLEELRLHDLRHSFASVPATGGESILIIRSLLGHSRVSTTERYAHLANDPLRRAADRTSGDIASWLSGAETEVTPLRQEKLKTR
jgi:integrase